MNKNLIAYRKILNISQVEMAKVAGVSSTSYNSKENEKSQFTQKEMFKIAKFLKEKGINTSVDELFFKNEVSILDT